MRARSCVSMCVCVCAHLREVSQEAFKTLFTDNFVIFKAPLALDSVNVTAQNFIISSGGIEKLPKNGNFKSRNVTGWTISHV